MTLRDTSNTPEKPWNQKQSIAQHVIDAQAPKAAPPSYKITHEDE